MHRWIGSLLLACLLVAGYCPAVRALDNRELKIAVTQEFETLNPLVMQMLATNFIYSMVGRTLNTLDADGKVVAQLAVRTPTLENGGATWIEEGGKKKLKVTWEIVAGAKWGDGTPVTGADVEFTWRVAANDNVGVPEREIFTDIERVEVDGANPKRFTLVYGKNHWDFYKLFTFYLLPKHLEEPVYTQYGSTKLGYEQHSLYVTKPTEPGLYCGPYRVAEVVLGSHVAMVPNPTFYGPAPKLQRVVIKIIPDTSTLEANLRSGTVDLISMLGLAHDQARSLRDRLAQEPTAPWRVEFKPSLMYEHIDLNLRNPLLQDVRVRQALLLALDRDELTKALFGGLQPPALHNLAPLDPWYTADPAVVALYPTSRRQAGKLLTEAGWVLAADGWRYKAGQRLTLPLMTTAGDKTRESVEQVLQAQWQQVGVEVPLKNEPARVFFGQTVRQGAYPALAMYAWISSPENSPRANLHSNSIPTKDNGFSGQNTGAWSNAAVDRALDQLDGEFDAQQRLVLIHQVLHAYTAEVPVLPLYYRADNAVVPKALKGFRLTGHQFSCANQVETWTLE